MANRELIEKLIGMLGSEHAGEVFNAAQKLVKIAKEEKKSLVELIVNKNKADVADAHMAHARYAYRSGPDAYFYEADVQYNPFKNNMAHVEVRNRLKQIRLSQSHLLSIWEKDFIDGIDISLVRYGSLTGRQLAAAMSIFTKANQK